MMQEMKAKDKEPTRVWQTRNMPVRLIDRARMVAAATGKNLGDVVSEALEEGLKQWDEFLPLPQRFDAQKIIDKPRKGLKPVESEGE